MFSAERNGLELIGAVLNCPTWFETAEALLDYGFENYQSRTALTAGQSAGTVRLRGGARDSVAVVAGSELSSAIAVGKQFTVHYAYAESLAAPIRKGDQIGTAYLQSSGETLASCPLLAAEDVDVWNFAAALKALMRNWLF